MFRVAIVSVLFLAAAVAQEPAHDMSHMNMGGSNQADGFLMGLASGTSMNPQSWPMPMLMLKQSNWSLMFMGQAFVVDKDELVAGQSFRVGAYTLGYTRDIGTFHKLQSGIGANFTSYSTPDALKQYYGNHPVSVNVFARFRLNLN